MGRLSPGGGSHEKFPHAGLVLLRHGSAVEAGLPDAAAGAGPTGACRGPPVITVWAPGGIAAVVVVLLVNWMPSTDAPTVGVVCPAAGAPPVPASGAVSVVAAPAAVRTSLFDPSSRVTPTMRAMRATATAAP